MSDHRGRGGNPHRGGYSEDYRGGHRGRGRGGYAEDYRGSHRGRGRGGYADDKKDDYDAGYDDDQDKYQKYDDDRKEGHRGGRGGHEGSRGRGMHKSYYDDDKKDSKDGGYKSKYGPYQHHCKDSKKFDMSQQPPKPGTVNDGGEYFIQNKISGKVLDSPDRMNIILCEPNKRTNQGFVLKQIGKDLYNILFFEDTSKGLEGGKAGTEIRLKKLSNSKDQNWKIESIGGDWFTIKTEGGMSLDATGLLNGTKIITYNPGQNQSQHFRFVPCNIRDISSNYSQQFTSTIRQGGCSEHGNPHLDLVIGANNKKQICLMEFINSEKQYWEFFKIGNTDNYIIRNSSKLKEFDNFYLAEIKGKLVFKRYDGNVGKEFIWKLIPDGKFQNIDLFNFVNLLSGKYICTGPHKNHFSGGFISLVDKKAEGTKFFI